MPMGSDGQSDFVDARTMLRPPRVAIVFDSEGGWHYWARLAIYAATQVWGGSGFILIPHSGGDVEPVLLQAASAYDPDYVLLLHITAGQFELGRPGVLPMLKDGAPATTAQRAEMIERIGPSLMKDPDGEKARQAVVAACTPYRHRTSRGVWVEESTWLDIDGEGALLTPVSNLEGVPGGSRLAAPPDWGGPVGVIAAARCGVMEEPVPGGSPQLNADDRLELIRWLLSAGDRGSPLSSMVWHPAAAMSVVPGELETVFDRGQHGLIVIKRGYEPDRPMLAVAGDQAADFALAFAWDRLYGRSIWLPSEWWPEPDVRTPEMTAIRLLLDDLGFDHRSPHGQLQLTTASLNSKTMTRLASVLQVPVLRQLSDPGQQVVRTVKVESARFSHQSLKVLAIDGHWDQQFTAPVRTGSSGIVMMTPPPAPVLENPDLARSRGLRWHADVELLSSAMPKGRGFDGQALFAPGENIHLTHVRSGRDGITYQAGRQDYVPAGTGTLSRLARPRLREPALAEWARLFANQSGHLVELSPAGRRSEMLCRLWDSRNDFIHAMTGPLLPVLRAFQPAHPKSADAYPDEEGVVLLREGYLTFAGMMKIAGTEVSSSTLREHVDDLASRAVLRRGLVLGCAVCGRPSFIPLGSLGQVNPCPRCAAPNELAQERWHLPPEEPSWFYDLHPVARELLADHGEVPLQLSRHLRSASTRYADTSELELRDITGNRIAEADLIAVSDDQLIIAEAKSNNALGKDSKETRRTAAKRATLAAAFRADQIILATTQDEWNPSSITAMRDAITGAKWVTGLPPALRLITGLGSSKIQDSRLDLKLGSSAQYS